MPFARFSTGAASIREFQARVVSSSNLFQGNGMTNKWTNKNNAISENGIFFFDFHLTEKELLIIM